MTTFLVVVRVYVRRRKNCHGMTAAGLLARSKSWVSMRLGLIEQMSVGVRQRIFAGAFSVYSYVYTLRQFMRMNGEGKKEVEEFVGAVSGKKLSMREGRVIS